jgi:hypothetical protein
MHLRRFLDIATSYSDAAAVSMRSLDWTHGAAAVTLPLKSALKVESLVLKSARFHPLGRYSRHDLIVLGAEIPRPRKCLHNLFRYFGERVTVIYEFDERLINENMMNSSSF